MADTKRADQYVSERAHAASPSAASSSA